MSPEYELIVHKFPEGKDITIYPISDVHLGAAECMEDQFRAFIDKVAETPDAYLVLGGDLLNNCTRSSVSDIFTEVYSPSKAKRIMAEILFPVRDRILCAVCGNHERRSNKDANADPMRDIMCKIDKEDVYRENIAFVKIQMGVEQKISGAARPTYVLAVTHGAGGGMLTSGAVLRGERFAYAISGVDALIFGHTHKNFTTISGKIHVDPHNNRVSVKPFRVLNMTSWLEWSGYPVQKMLLPSVHGIQKITLCGDHKEMVVTM